ncbi:Mbeg1-like protein, partial [Lacticaseibacillus paracasei]
FDHLPQPLASQVAHVYSFDGPSGVPLDPSHRDRVTKLVPQSSLIGVSLDPAMNFEVVKSRVKLFGQHDVLTWNIADTTFAHLPTTTWASRYFQKTFA